MIRPHALMRPLGTGLAQSVAAQQKQRATIRSCAHARRSSQPDSGFTLIEVLIALAILGIALPVLLAAFGTTLRRSHDSEAKLEAATIAQSLLAGAGAEAPLQLGTTSGKSDGRYAYAVTVTPYGEPGLSEDFAVQLYQVTAKISWDEGKRSLALATLRLAPKAVAPQEPTPKEPMPKEPPP